MAHAQKPDFVFRRDGRVHLNWRGRQFSRLLAAEAFASALVMLDTPCSEVVKGTGYPPHSPVSPSLPLPCVTVCNHIAIGLYCAAANIVGCICQVRLALNCVMTNRQVLANCSGYQNCFANGVSVFDIAVKYGVLYFGMLLYTLLNSFFCMNCSEVWFRREKISS
jgi:hypothetical protein